MANQKSEIRNGATVEFLDEFNRKKKGVVVRQVPKGEYSQDKESVAINVKGQAGAYVRTKDEVKKA